MSFHYWILLFETLFNIFNSKACNFDASKDISTFFDIQCSPYQKNCQSLLFKKVANKVLYVFIFLMKSCLKNMKIELHNQIQEKFFNPFAIYSHDVICPMPLCHGEILSRAASLLHSGRFSIKPEVQKSRKIPL